MTTAKTTMSSSSPPKGTTATATSTSTTVLPNDEEVTKLLQLTNFSKREILEFYTRTDMNDTNMDGLIDFIEFRSLCNNAGLFQEVLVELLWKFFVDNDMSEKITKYKMVLALSPILRGTTKDIATMFFKVYDMDKTGVLTSDEIIEAYSILMSQRYQMNVKTQRLNLTKQRTSIMVTGASARVSIKDGVVDTTETSFQPLKLSETSKTIIRDWVYESTNGGVDAFDRDAFVAAVLNREQQKREKSGNTIKNEKDDATVNDGISSNKKGSSTKRNRGFALFGRYNISLHGVYYFLLLAVYSTGGVFALFAVATMTERFMVRMDIDEAQVGVLNTAYFVAAIIGPFVGGYVMDNYTGPIVVSAGANTIVMIGSMIQWLASTPSLYNLLVFGRFLIGFGLETTFVAWAECYGVIFPNYFGLMVGIMTGIVNIEVFLSFQVLPWIADSRSSPNIPFDVNGTNAALRFCFLLCLVSMIASYLVVFSRYMEERKKKKKSKVDDDDNSDAAVLTRTFGALAKAALPSPPSGLARFKLPVSLFLTIVAIKAMAYYFNTFSLYAMPIYERQFGFTEAQASFATGLAPLMVVPLAPIMGAITDKYGSRARVAAVLCLCGVLAMIALLVIKSSAAVWLATVLLTIMSSGIGNSIVTIPLIVGPTRAGLGYGLYAIFGNGIDAINAYVGGVLIASSSSESNQTAAAAATTTGGTSPFLWYSLCYLLLGFFCWIGIYLLERNMSFLEHPLADIVETKLENLHFASVCAIVNDPNEIQKVKNVKPNDEEHQPLQEGEKAKM